MQAQEEGLIPTPEIIDEDIEDSDYDKVVRFKIRGSFWPDEAWKKLLLRNARATRLADNDAWTAAILVVYPPEIIGLTYATPGIARGGRGDWKIEFGDPEGARSERVSDAVAMARRRFIGKFVEDRDGRIATSQEAVIHQILTTTGYGPRRSRGARRVEMSRPLFPWIRLRPALHEVTFRR
jgi:hypothetical protein